MTKSRFARFAVFASMLVLSAAASAMPLNYCGVYAQGLRVPTYGAKGQVVPDPVGDDPGFNVVSEAMPLSQLTGTGASATMFLAQTPGASSDPDDIALLNEWLSSTFTFKFPTTTAMAGWWARNGVVEGAVVLVQTTPTKAWELKFITTDQTARVFRASCNFGK